MSVSYEGKQVGEVLSISLPQRGRVEWSWKAVEDRMVDAMRHWWRSSDSEARYNLGGRISSIWRQAWTDRLDLIRHDGLVDLKAEEPRPLPLSRDDIARMVEASEWLRFVPDRDRRLVIVVLVKLASGHKTVPWLTIWKALGRGKPGPEGLRSRYSRAITCVAVALNGGNSPRNAVNPSVSFPSK